MEVMFGRYFNKGVKVLDAPHIGFIVRETDSKIVVLGHSNNRFDIPKSRIIAVGEECNRRHGFS